MKVAKSQVEPLTKMIDGFEEAMLAYEMAKEAGDNELLVEADELLFGLEKAMGKVELLSLLSGKHDHRNCYFNISAGDGGTEANDWAEILDRMYAMFFDKHHRECKKQ